MFLAFQMTNRKQMQPFERVATAVTRSLVAAAVWPPLRLRLANRSKTRDAY